MFLVLCAEKGYVLKYLKYIGSKESKTKVRHIYHIHIPTIKLKQMPYVTCKRLSVKAFIFL